MSPSLDRTSRSARITALVAGMLLVVAGVWLTVTRIQARNDAAVARARTAFQQDLTLAYDAIGEPTQRASTALSTLRELLQEQLAVSGRTGEELAAERDDELTALTRAAAQVTAASAAPVPAAAPELDPDAPTSLNRHLAQLRIDAQDLAEELEATAAAVLRWTTALAELRRAALAYAEAAGAQPDTTDPTALAASWRSERPALEVYGAAADAAADVPGLAPIAAAHRAYVDANLAWIAEAVDLLDAGRLNTYNRRLDEVFGVDDPLGFRAALEDAVERSFDSGVLTDLDRARDRATELLDRIGEARRVAPVVLDSEASTDR